MKVIISNIRILSNFYKISKIKLPFLLPCTYLLYYESFDYEKRTLNTNYEMIFNKIAKIDITATEFFLASDLNDKYIKLSIHDSIALSIAKINDFPLLTDDKNLIEAAIKEKVRVITTGSLLDYLISNNYISESEYNYCFKKLILNKRQLTVKEIQLDSEIIQI